jgi:lysophospholipase L1-like esterase
MLTLLCQKSLRQSSSGTHRPARAALSRHALLCAGALAAVTLLNPAQARSAEPACTLSGSSLDQTLIRTRSHLTQGRTLTIVAIGSSSTEGAGASSPGASYPSRLEALLTKRFPGITIRVLNRGVGGEEEADMLARFDRDVIAAKPDLVLWQVASNAVMRNRRLSAQETLIRKGIARLKRTGADVVLIDPQYTTAILAQSVAVPMVDLISTEARRQHIGVFRRFELMKDWREKEHIPFDEFSIDDGLHMNDWGYDCLARNLAAAIVDSAMPPAMAAVPAPRS